MAKQYLKLQQTGINSGICYNIGTTAYPYGGCSGYSAVEHAWSASAFRKAEDGGTGDSSSTNACWVPALSAGTVAITHQTGQLGLSMWHRGTYTYRLNVINSRNNNMRWKELYVCVIDQDSPTSCSATSTIASNTSVNTLISAAGVYTATAVSVADYPSLTSDTMMFVLVFSEATDSAGGLFWYSDQVIDTPICIGFDDVGPVDIAATQMSPSIETTLLMYPDQADTVVSVPPGMSPTVTAGAYVSAGYATATASAIEGADVDSDVEVVPAPATVTAIMTGGHVVYHDYEVVPTAASLTATMTGGHVVEGLEVETVTKAPADIYSLYKWGAPTVSGATQAAPTSRQHRIVAGGGLEAGAISSAAAERGQTASSGVSAPSFALALDVEPVEGTTVLV